MEQFELIYDFVDGNLSPGKETELFRFLNENEEARAELKYAMAMKSAVKNDVKASTPSAKSTLAIFSGLGFTPPPTIPIPTKIPWSTRFIDYLAKYKQGLIGGSLAAGLTAAVLLLMLNPKDRSGNTISLNDYKPAKPSVAAVSSIESDNNTVNNNTKINPTEKSEKVKVVYKYAYVVPKDLAEKIDKLNSQIAKYEKDNLENKNVNQNLATNNNTKDLTEIVPVNNFKQETSLMNTNPSMEVVRTVYVPRDVNSGTLPLADILSNTDTQNKLFGMNLEFYGSQYFNDNPANIKPQSEQTLNNMAIAALYPIGSDFYAGLDYRRENFLQKFDGTELVTSADGKIKESYFSYQQNPNFQTVSGVVRYMPSYTNFGFASLFAQTSIGGNSVGMVLRGMAGARMAISSNYFLLVGYDYSSLFYSHQNKNYNCAKSGLQIGAAIKF